MFTNSKQFLLVLLLLTLFITPFLVSAQTSNQSLIDLLSARIAQLKAQLNLLKNPNSQLVNTNGSVVGMTAQSGEIEVSVNTPEICHDGWCWENPGPQGNSLNDLFAFSVNDIWAVGVAGTILRWNGTEWLRTESNTKNELTGIWGSAPNDLWAVGRNQTLLHWNGTSWSTVREGTLSSYSDIWGTGVSDIWVTNLQGGMVHFNGTTWTDVAGPTIRLLTGASGEIFGWASGIGMYRYSNGLWLLVPNSNTTILNPNSMRVISSMDVWMVGTQGKVAHWNGSSWSDIPLGINANMKAVWSSGPDDVLVAGYNGEMRRWNGSNWSAPQLNRYTDSNQFEALVGTGPNDIWAVGSYGLIRHWDGVWWQTASGFRKEIYGFWGSVPNQIWAACTNGACFWNGTSWSRQAMGVPPMAAVFGFNDNDVWLLGHIGSVFRWDGNNRASLRFSSATT